MPCEGSSTEPFARRARQQADEHGANAEAERTKLRSRDCKGANAKPRRLDNDGTKCSKSFPEAARAAVAVSVSVRLLTRAAEVFTQTRQGAAPRSSPFQIRPASGLFRQRLTSLLGLTL